MPITFMAAALAFSHVFFLSNSSSPSKLFFFSLVKIFLLMGFLVSAGPSCLHTQQFVSVRRGQPAQAGCLGGSYRHLELVVLSSLWAYEDSRTLPMYSAVFSACKIMVSYLT